MKVLSFLIICLIVSNNTVSISKDEKRRINRIEDLPTSKEPRKLEDGGYIIVHYFKACNYSSGFNYNIQSRNSISRIRLNNDEKIFEKDINIEVPENSNLTLYFDSPPESFEYFFFSDKHKLNIDLVDLTNFNCLELTNMNTMFSGCSSLQSVSF